MVDGPVQMGPTIMVNDLQAYHLGILLSWTRMRSTEQWSSMEALLNQLPQVIYQSMHCCVKPAL